MFSEQENYTLNEPSNNRAASVSSPNKFNSNFYNTEYIIPQIDITSYAANDHRNYELYPTNLPSEITFQRTRPTSELQDTSLPKNDLNCFQSNEQQYLSTVNMPLNGDRSEKSVNFGPNEKINNDSQKSVNIVPKIRIKPLRTEISENTGLAPPQLSERTRKIQKTVRLIENVLINTKTGKPEKDPLKITDFKTEIDSDDEVLSKKVTHDLKKEFQTKESEYVAKSTANKTKESENQINSEIIHDVRVKVEHTNWPDIDYINPFHRDCNGMPKDGVGNFKVINMEISEEEALNTIKNGQVSNSVAYYECPHCSILLIHPKRFLIHVKWHNFGLKNNKRQTKCLENQRKREMMNMMKSEEMAEKLANLEESNYKIYRCKQCDIIFSGKHSLSTHRKNQHSQDQMQCRICHEMFMGRRELRAHLHTHKATDNGYQCPHCPKKFKFRHSLLKHSDTHLDKVHTCKQCSKKFGSNTLLKAHIKTHERSSRGTSHHCSYCGKGFYDNYSLIVHERTHNNDKPFQCDICKSAFVSNSSLKRHYRVSHVANNSKPHTCKVCMKCFSTERIRDRHELRTHADSNVFPHGCELCDKRYMKRKDLRNHIYKIHPNVKLKAQELN